jgi:N6-L-threonylcarbamoyladenine synthase
MKILGIETSCDETGIALIEGSGGLKSPRFKVLKNLVASQIKIHRPFGGVVPNLAKREHQKNLPILFSRLSKTREWHDRSINELDIIAVTVGPGLEPALWSGITFAKELGEKLKVPVVGANHLEGHLYSFLLPTKSLSSKFYVLSPRKVLPAIALIVSGGHTILLRVKDLKTWKKLGETRDDAVGEAFDKVARLLGLPYPGGPELEKLAAKGNPDAINFPRPMMHDKSYDFSLSGLKTSVLYHLRDRETISSKGINILGRSSKSVNNMKADVAASFQRAAIDVLVYKTLKAVEEYGAKSILLSGGVAANKFLRKELKKSAEELGVRFLVADPEYNTDNAVMIAAAGYLAHLRGKKYKLVAKGDMNI